MTLFRSNDLKPKFRSPEQDSRPRRRLPTGVPRTLESSTARRARAADDAWAEFLDAIRRSASARLEVLKGQAERDLISCPWAKLIGCGADCRCGGTKTVTIEFLRRHYSTFVAAIEKVVA